MIRAMAFDLDGTLVQTEKLKALSYAIVGLHSSEVLDHAWVVHDHDQLLDTVRRRITEHNQVAHT